MNSPHAPAQPPRGTPPARDLTDAELQELDELLAGTPEPLEPLDVTMLDGYLCGVLVQPTLIASEQWLPHVFDAEGRPLPDDTDPVWRERVTALVLRHHAALNRSLAEDGWFDPIVIEEDEAASDAEAIDPVLAAMPPLSRALLPWISGFQLANADFPALFELDDDDVAGALARLLRHLPPETDEEREVIQMLDREHPLADLDAAIEDLVANVADLWDLTSETRYRVETVRHAEPKVGRNDPCPCGSGRKYKHCHGA